MPSDDRTAPIFAVLAPARDAFRSAVTDAAEALRTQLDGQRVTVNGRGERAAMELGAFAAGHIDTDRFAELFSQRPTLDERSLTLLERSRAALATIATAGEAPFRVRVRAGSDMVAEVGAALAVAGRAFAAARIAELVRLGRTQQALTEDLIAGLPFARWTRGELRIAPPLLVEVEGADFQPAGLAQFLDGAQKLVFIVNAPAAPAALARLITPGVFVMQTTDAADLGKLGTFDGPAIGALVPEGCATFVHDPTATPPLAVTYLPEQAPPARTGRASAFQQAQELALLRTLVDATKPDMPPVAQPMVTAPAENVEKNDEPPPADRLAAWLLQQADLTSIA